MSTEENKQETIEETTEEKEVVEETIEEITEEVIEEATEEPAEETVEEATEETAEEVTEEAIEEPAEETTEETTEENVEASPKKFNKKWIAIIVAAVVVILAGVYFAFAYYYSERFLVGTFVNGTDCSGKTMKEVEAMIQKQVEEYVLVVEAIGIEKQEIKGTDIDIRYIGYNQIKEAFDKQNSYLWPKALFVGKNIKAEIVFEYSAEKLDAAITALECAKAEKQVAPTAATVVYQDGAFVIQEEKYGTQLDMAKFSDVMHSSVKTIDTDVNLEETGCYVLPRFTTESPEVVTAKEAMNNYLNAEITYSLDAIEVVLNRDAFASWIYVDENMAPVVSVEQAKKFAGTLGSKYNTANRAGELISPTGKKVGLQNATLGRLVGTDAECEQLIKDIQEGKKVTRSPILSRQAMADGQYVWGNRYVEVDITEQHMWFVQNGAVEFETDVVTGLKGKNDTPTGIYSLLEKIPNTTLVGRIVNGKPLYRTPVKYWMRVTWSGIGFHDASWQSSFGGTRYVTNGSHGCINMPPAKAGEFYNMITIGTPVVIHY